MSDKIVVLVVDDEDDVLTYLTSLLEDNGYDTLTAHDGAEGLKIAKEKKPDLISLDITMAEESGVKMYRKIREDKETSDIPVIIVTGVASDFKSFIESRKQVNPPQGYFEKPIDKDAYLAKIKEITRIRK